MLIAKEFRIQPSEIYKLQFFEYEWLIADIQDYNKEKQSQAEAQEKEQEQMRKSMGNFNKPPKMPAMPTFTMPTFTMPKL